MDTKNQPEPQKYNAKIQEIIVRLKDANQKLDYIIESISEVYHRPINCPFYDPHLHYNDNKDTDPSDYS